MTSLKKAMSSVDILFNDTCREAKKESGGIGYLLHTSGIVVVSDLEATGQSPPQVSKLWPWFLHVSNT